MLLFTASLWRVLWRLFPFLGDVYFPDINGIWQGSIKFLDRGVDRELSAKVRIKQNLWSITLDLNSETSKSVTLVAFPMTESGNKILYYVYRNTPKRPDYAEYKGTTILEINTDDEKLYLRGNYYTDRLTNGRIELIRTSDNPNQSHEL